MSTDDFTVDADTLAALVTRMRECESDLESLTNRVEGSVARLHETWHGEAAEAQRLAHAEWEKGLAAMREVIADLAAKGDVAHSNYTDAAATNLSMWERTR